MPTGRVDNSVKDKRRGEKILSLMLEVVPEGSFVRVSSRLVKVDTPDKRMYGVAEGDEGEVLADTVQD